MKDYSQLIIELKKHFLLMNESKGLIVVEDDAALEHIVSAFATNISKRNFEVISLDEEEAKRIYKNKESLRENGGYALVVVKNCYDIENVLVQDVLRFLEKRAKAHAGELKILLCSTIPVSLGNAHGDLVLDYVGEKVIYAEETKTTESKIIEDKLNKIIDSTPIRNDKRRVGYYILIDENCNEYRFDIYEDQVKGMLALRKDKECLKGEVKPEPSAVIEKFFSYGCVKPLESDICIFINAYRTMELPPRMLLG